MVSTSFPMNRSDWRGRFIWNLSASLAARDDVALSLWAAATDLPAGVKFAAPGGDIEWLRSLAERGGMAHLLRTSGVRALPAAIGLLARLRRLYASRKEIDVIHANWLQNAIPLFGTKHPAVVSVLGTDFRLLNLPGMRMAIRAALRGRRAVLAPNAEWMVPRLQGYFGDVAQVQAIPFGVDDKWFAIERTAPTGGGRDWLVVSRVTAAKIGPLFEWGEGLFGQEDRLHLLGPMQERLTLPPWVRYHGPTNPEELRRRWFPSASGLITLSQHDEGRPQVMLEAMASGIPVIASDLAAHRDFVRDGMTGKLVRSAAELGDALDTLRDLESNRRLGEAARAWVAREIGTWTNTAERYVAAYRSVLV